MAEDVCRSCGRPLPRRASRRGRATVYCSAACRQKAYRARHTPAADATVRALIADIEGRVKRLAQQRPATFYSEVEALSSSVGKLRRIARAAAPVPEPIETAQIVTPTHVTESALSASEVRSSVGEDAVAAVRSGDERLFSGLVEPYRRELHVHCYRMVGSFDDAEDLVQETFLRAWRKRDSFRGRSTFRAWLYRIATNACLDFLRRHTRRPRLYAAMPGVDPGGAEPPPRIAWLQPYPDRLLDEIASGEEEPDAAVVARETIELVFLAAIQHLSPRQRAVLIIRDVLGWTATETAALLETSVAAVNSALQRARPALRKHLPPRRLEWTGSAPTSAEERAILKRYMDAAARADVAAMAAMLSEDATLTMPPNPMWYTGRESIIAAVEQVFDAGSPQYFGRWRHLPTRANRQPAVAAYVQRPGTVVYRAQVLDVLRIAHGEIVEITSFEPHLFPAFGLPLTL